MIRKITTILPALLLFLTGCVKVTIQDAEHSNRGKLFLITDWSQRSEGVEIPERYTVDNAGEKVIIKGDESQHPLLLAQGVHTLYLYNEASKISVNGALVASENDPMLGWQFWGELVKFDVRKDEVYRTVVKMKQLTRQLNFDLTLTNTTPKIKSIEAVMSGVALGWDCKENRALGQPAKITPHFTVEHNKLKAMCIILGVIGDKQELTVKINFDDGTSEQIVDDITRQLTDFNSDKIVPLTITGTYSLPVSAGVTGTIKGWDVVEGERITVRWQ